MLTTLRLAVVMTALCASQAMAQADWTGFYAGIQAGSLDAQTNIAAEGDATSYGLHAGYRWDLGDWIAGGELEFDGTSIALGGGTARVDDVLRIKGTIGYDLGPAVIYGAVGFAELGTSLGSETGDFFGIGVAYQVSPSATLGLELLEHDFDTLNGTPIEAEATSLSARASFRF